MKLKINAKPLSINSSYRGGRKYRTKKLLDYQEQAGWQVKIQAKNKRVAGLIQIDYKFFVKSFKRIDVDNMVKPLQDILVMQGVIDDDVNVIKITAEKYPVPTWEQEHSILIIKPYGNKNSTNQ